jgi:hypothetical protein
MKPINTAVAITAILLAVTASGGQRILQPRDVVAQALLEEKREKAALRAEANAPGMGRAQQRRVEQVIASSARAEEHRIAEYEKFKMDQQIALAQASAPSTVTNNYFSTGTEQSLATESTGSVRSSKYIKVAGVPRSDSYSVRREAPVATREQSAGEKPYPDEFYKMQVIQESIDRLVSRLDAMELPAVGEQVTADEPTQAKARPALENK